MSGIILRSLSLQAGRNSVVRLRQKGSSGQIRNGLLNRKVNLSVKCTMTEGETVQKNVLVPIADGSEEMEAVIIVDVLRRAGANVTVASVGEYKEVICSRKVQLVADKLLADVANQQFDLIALPGGMPGADYLQKSAQLKEMLINQKEEGRLWSAICASPAVVLEGNALLGKLKSTSHPNFQSRLQNQDHIGERVVVDGNLVTSQGPGTALEFALQLIKQLYGEEKMMQIAGPMVMYDFKAV
eukprot:TRINITY_DN5159_c0_g1_i1.p1 TRINITY_DN5159_c0_g1~~TRINITY_DN5159_c0_g1_i1.p1  ORF type:complete len:242 (-),score=46.31 TRINITY_DN5159_c0_g1_i1:139-864(-)